ncbi:hypothetical protein I4U23_014823 [Adineta vaga]|nr:hypothetical protein I4U23_014823 [Adineta vaga]
MNLIHLFIQNKLYIFISLFIYILFWLILTVYKQSTITIDYQHEISSSNFDFILEYLTKCHINLLLIDPIVLEYLFIQQLPFRQLQKRLITFGIFNDSLQLIEPILSMRNFSVKISKTDTNTRIDHIFIEHNQQIIHLAVLHQQNSYFLIHQNHLSLPTDLKLSYGDILRIIEPDNQFIRREFLFTFPQNISHFLWLYNTSEFLQCNQTLANEMKMKYHLYQNISQLNLTILPMKTISNALTKFEKHYWLAGGTLLGWYRHCGLIPYTQDVDFGLFAEEYDESIRRYFLGNPIVYLWGTLGLVNDSLEYRLFTGEYTFDLFWAYRETNHRWCGYQVKRVKYRRILPLLPKLCSCDLFGFRFSIPCSPIDYLNNEYGYNQWQTPLEKNYTWINVKYNSIWDDLSWMYAIRLYTRDGRVRRDKYAIDWIADQFNYSMKTKATFRSILWKQNDST